MVARMRVLQIAPVPREIGGVNTGGVPTHAWGLITHLAQRGHDVAVLADNRPYGDPWPDIVDGIAVYGGRGFSGPRRVRRMLHPTTLSAVASAKRHLGPLWRWRWVANAVSACSQVIDDFRPDIVHVHALEGRFAVAYSAGREKIPLITTAHSTHYVEYADDDMRDYNEALIVRSLAAARDIIFVSHWDAERYGRMFPGTFDHARIYVLPNPIDAEEYEPIPRDEARRLVGVSDGETLLLSIGNLIPRKDPAAFVRAIGILRTEGVDVRGIMVGEGPLKDKMRALVTELGLTDVIRLEGHAPQDLISAYYSAADVFVFPSLMESWGLAGVEAMLSGCPVVGTFEVMPEVVPEFAGVYVPSHDPADVAAGLKVALERDWDREAIRRHALGFDWKHRVRDFEEVYRTLLGNAIG